MKNSNYYLLIWLMVAISCSTDIGPTKMDLLVGSLWVFVEADNDTYGDYDYMEYFEIDFMKNGSYELYQIYDGEEWYGSGSWDLSDGKSISGLTLRSGGDDFAISIQSVTKNELVLDAEGILLTFDAQ